LRTSAVTRGAAARRRIGQAEGRVTGYGFRTAAVSHR
jgi:hypothetical protein